ncbi:MAG: endolytic transglycosylase MltG [Candidatus Taylorbacteria bacterium]
MKNLDKCLNKRSLVIGGFVFATIVGAFIFWPHEVAPQPQTYFTVNRGDSVFQVANNLKQARLIYGRARFVFPLLLSGKFREIKAGKYLIPAGEDESGIAELLVRGKTAPVAITVIPGFTVNDIARLLSRAGVAKSDEFLRLTMPSESKVGLEGYLYPDTYLFESGESTEKIVKTMTDNFHLHFSPDLTGKSQKRSLEEVVIMASILEKEVKTPEDKKMVAGILWKRLDYKLPLQVDSTGNYFLTRQTKLEYNTYEFVGLPFGPICNPSLASLEAALDPTESPFWYYLSALDGHTIYSHTLGEHLINKAKYLE